MRMPLTKKDSLYQIQRQLGHPLTNPTKPLKTYCKSSLFHWYSATERGAMLPTPLLVMWKHSKELQDKVNRQ